MGTLPSDAKEHSLSFAPSALELEDLPRARMYNRGIYNTCKVCTRKCAQLFSCQVEHSSFIFYRSRKRKNNGNISIRQATLYKLLVTLYLYAIHRKLIGPMSALFAFYLSFQVGREWGTMGYNGLFFQWIVFQRIFVPEE